MHLVRVDDPSDHQQCGLECSPNRVYNKHKKMEMLQIGDNALIQIPSF